MAKGVATRGTYGQQRQRQQQRQAEGGVGRLIYALTGLALLGAGGYMIWHYLGRPNTDDIVDAWNDWGGFGDFSDVLGNLTDLDYGDLYDADPFVADNSTKAWENEGMGVTVQVINALDDTWQDEFALAVSDWENGSPDALTLVVSRGEVDYSCKEQDGVLKVCSGNFGDTGWLGINDLLFIEATGQIISSVAKMNEYYLRNADNAKRQFTMCHEIGHGFGLPHTDEVFTNPSLGNCMDYTNKPEENMHPDQSNYNRLVSIYGKVGGRRLSLLRRLSTIDKRTDVPTLTKELREEYSNAMDEIQKVSVRRALSDLEEEESSRWMLIEEHSHGAVYERAIGNHFRVQATVLHELDSSK